MPGRNRRGGRMMAPRIPRSVSNTNDTAAGNQEDETIAVDINAEHSAGIRETEDFF